MVSDYLSNARDVVVILTGVAGLLFGLYKYRKAREAECILQIELFFEARAVAFSTVVSVGVQIKNVGRAATFVPVEKLKEATFSVRKISCPGLDARLEWEQLEHLKLVEALEYLRDKDWDGYYPAEPVIFEPGAADVYRVFFATDYHGPVWVRAALVDQNDFKWRADQLFVVP